MAEEILPVIKWLTICLLILRLFVFLVAFRLPKVCHFYLYIEVTICALTALAPRSAHQDWEYMAQYYFDTIIINFCLFYCDFWPNLIYSYAVNITVLVSGVIVYEQSFRDFNKVGLFISLLVFQFVALTLCHIFITKVSLMYIDSEVGRLTNPSLNDILE